MPYRSDYSLEVGIDIPFKPERKGIPRRLADLA